MPTSNMFSKKFSPFMYAASVNQEKMTLQYTGIYDACSVFTYYVCRSTNELHYNKCLITQQLCVLY